MAGHEEEDIVPAPADTEESRTLFQTSIIGILIKHQP